MSPSRIGKYEILRQIGEGATATVHLARDAFAGREVALKLIRPEVLHDPAAGRRARHLLATEASLAGKLAHPHIVQIHDAVVDEDRGYIVMEYVAGGTLKPYTAVDKLLPVERLAEIVFKCTRALGYAHRLGITHRDIKPANILLAGPGGDDGDIKISDFGAAIHTADQTRTQVTGIGSPAYMSPEQVQDQPLDFRTDIWSLGVVLYQLLTGRLPFEAAADYAVIYQICNTEPPPPSTFRAGTPAALDAVVARALRKEPAERYGSWEEFSHALLQACRAAGPADWRQDFADSGKFETLRALPFFAEFSDGEIWEVVRFSHWEDAAPGARIMQDGEPGDHFCFLLEGELAVEKHGRVLDLLATGACFGEMAVIGRNGHVRGADVVARTPAKVASIPGAALRHASDACRMHFYEAFLGVLCGRLTAANDRLSAT